MLIARRSRSGLDIWPGFVDALASLLMVVIFVLLVFVIGQFTLGEQIEGQGREISSLQGQLASLASQLLLEQAKGNQQQLALTDLQGKLEASLKSNEQLTFSLGQAEAELTMKAGELVKSQQDLEKLALDIKALTARKEELMATIAARDKTLNEESKKRIENEAQASLLNQQLLAMRQQLQEIQTLIDDYKIRDKKANAQIADLGKQLNVALANKVNELAGYRSEFFGKLKQVLGNKPGIQIVGDRFVVQSEVLFDVGSAELGIEGKLQLSRLASALLEIAKEIPPSVNWVLQVDGHTDRTPIKSSLYGDNWALSTARAISVVHVLISQGIPPTNLAAAGFAEFNPLDNGNSPDALARNRRIELKLTNR